MRDVAPERTGWRDEKISLRHRQWGFDCPGVDIDFLMVEYDKAKVAGLVEYKNEWAAPQYSSHPSYKALIDLADRAGVPFLACRYGSDFSWWKVVPMNSRAKKLLREPAELSERGFVDLLYRMRGRQMPADLFDVAI